MRLQIEVGRVRVNVPVHRSDAAACDRGDDVQTNKRRWPVCIQHDELYSQVVAQTDFH